MDKYASYSNVYLISRSTSVAWDDIVRNEPFLVVGDGLEAKDIADNLNIGEDAMNHPYWDYQVTPVPYKHHN